MILELHLDSVFWFGIGRYFPGILPTDTKGNLTWSGRFGIVHLEGTPFFPQKESSAPYLMDQAPLLREK
jgi:hypothetical protein